MMAAKRALKILGFVAFALVGVGVAVWIYGASLPSELRADRTVTLDAPVQEVYRLVTDVARQPEWRSDVRTVTLQDGGKRWTEETRQGIAVDFEEVERVPLQTYAIRFQSAQGFEGGWVGSFKSLSSGDTELKVVETVRTSSPIGRVIQRMLAPAGAHTDLYLKDLKQALAARAR